MKSKRVSHGAGFRATFLAATLATLVSCGGGGGGGGGGAPPLTANAGPDRAVTQGDNVTLSAAGSTIPDADAGSATYQWQFLGDNLGPAPVLSGQNSATPTFLAPGTTDGGGLGRTLTFRLTLTAGGVSVTDQVNVAVAPVGDALPVADLADLNLGSAARLVSVSCASPGNCSAGGYYSLATPETDTLREAFVVSQSNGVWGAGTPVPGLPALNVGNYAEVLSVSCASAGNCTAGGFYNDGDDSEGEGRQGFVVSQVDGTWGAPVTMPSPELNISANANVRSVSCPSPGNCTAVGDWAQDGTFLMGFAVTQSDGVWGTPVQLFTPFGPPRLDFANVSQVSCGSAANCSAAGPISIPGQPGRTAFVATQTSGVWGVPASIMPGLPELAVSGFASLQSLSCASPGNCTAVGWYGSAVGQNQGFVVSQVNGVWNDAMPLPGLQALNVFANAVVQSVSCGGPGNCSAGGYFTAPGGGQAFVASQIDGEWGNATPVPGMTELNVDGEAQVLSLSCATPGNCTAGGFYRDNGSQGFVVSQSSGVWGAAVPVPGLGELNIGNNARVLTVSCGGAGACSFGGSYSTATEPFVTREQAFVGSVGPSSAP